MANAPQQSSSQATASSDAKPAEAPRKPSYPNLRSPQMQQLMRQQRATTVVDGQGDAQPYNQFCHDPRCQQALVKRSMYTGDPNHTELVCSWDPSHPQPQLRRPGDFENRDE